MRNKQIIRNGDVFETLLPDGRFGAIRIIKTEDKSYLIATTAYISTEPPEISNPHLKAILIKTFGNWQGRAGICGYSGYSNSIQTRRYVGNIPLSPEEEQMRLWFGPGGYMVSSWGTWVGQDVHRQWEWDNDREAYEAETLREEEKNKKAQDIQPKPKKMLSDEAFWKLIGLLNWKQTGDDEAVIAPVVNAVASFRKSELHQFDEALSYKLFLLDTPQHAKYSVTDVSEDWEKSLSADGFLYCRCAVVANGQEYYEKILRNPSEMPRHLEFEALLSVSRNAYTKKTGDEDYDYSSGCSYETFSNRDAWRKKKLS